MSERRIYCKENSLDLLVVFWSAFCSCEQGYYQKQPGCKRDIFCDFEESRFFKEESYFRSFGRNRDQDSPIRGGWNLNRGTIHLTFPVRIIKCGDAGIASLPQQCKHAVGTFQFSISMAYFQSWLSGYCRVRQLLPHGPPAFASGFFVYLCNIFIEHSFRIGAGRIIWVMLKSK